MKMVVTHPVRTLDEIAAIVAKHGCFTAPLGLPHYRYDKTRGAVAFLQRHKLINFHKKVDIQRYFVKGSNLPQWVEAGCPPIRQWVKTLKDKTDGHCSEASGTHGSTDARTEG